MGTDSKLLPIPLSGGIDQTMDELAAPPGTIRRSINTRVRQGGSLEQRRGVHGFAVSTPSYMANFRATGAVEFAGSIGNSPALGIAGKAYAHDRLSQVGFYAGEYSQYEPLSRETAILTERQHGILGCRHIAVGRDLQGRRYTAIASMSPADVECRIQNEAGNTIASFTVNAPSVERIELVASQVAPYIYLLVDQAGNSAFALNYAIHLSDRISVVQDSLGFASTGSQWSAQPVPPGAVLGLATAPDFAIVRDVINDEVDLSYQSVTQGLPNADNIRVPSMSAIRRVGFAPGKTPQSFMVVGLTTSPLNPATIATAPVNFVALPQFSAPHDRVLATGTLIRSPSRDYSAPIIAATDDPNRFLWVASNGLTSFGDLVIPSGPPRVRVIATMMGVPLSLMDSQGSIWMTTDAGESPATKRASRAVLLTHPGAVPSGADYSRPLAQLTTSRQFPDAVRNSVTWVPAQNQYSRVAEDGAEFSVLLPAQLRSQASGLFSLEKYKYRNTSSSSSGKAALGRGSLIVSGQPVEVFRSPNRLGIGVVTGAPTFAARQSLASEVGFVGEPYIATMAAASGANIAPGTRLYTSLFEWLSPAGERHRSRPATPRSFANTSLAGVLLHTPEEFLSQRFPSPRVHYYRTVDGQKQFLRISPDTGVEPGTQFYDHNSDDDIRDNEVLYTDGGVQPNDLAPSCRFMALGEDRLWLGGLFESDIIQCSKFFVPREPVQFSDLDSFKVRLPFPCTGLAYLDGSLVAFCESSTYLISGAGPNNQGVGGFTLRPIADNVGCDDHRSIIATSIGVFFKSKRGIQLLPRGFGSPEQIRNLNELMGDFGDGFTEVIGATTRDYSDEETVRFLLRNPSTNRRIVATYELGTSTWNYDVIKDENGNEVPLSAIGDGPEGVVYGAGSGTYRFMTELEGLAGTPYDSMGSTVNRFLSEVHLSKMSVFGPAGEGKAKAVTLRGFAPATGAQVSLSLVTDYGTQTHTFSGIGSGTFFRRVVPALQDSSEMQISATFSTGVGRKTGLKLLSLTLELDPKAGARRARQGEQE